MASEISKIVNLRQIVIGVLVLALGTLVYLVDRAPHETYFVSESRVDISLHDTLPGLFGRIGASLPTFTHVFAFIMITAGLINCRRRGYLVIAFSWFIIDAAFEIGQKYKDAAVRWVPSWFSGIPFLENTENYFQNGTFDWIDMATIFLGAITAYIVLVMTSDINRAPGPDTRP